MIIYHFQQADYVLQEMKPHSPKILTMRQTRGKKAIIQELVYRQTSVGFNLRGYGMVETLKLYIYI